MGNLFLILSLHLEFEFLLRGKIVKLSRNIKKKVDLMTHCVYKQFHITKLALLYKWKHLEAIKFYVRDSVRKGIY